MTSIALDLGNTFTKVGLFEGSFLKEVRKFDAKAFQAVQSYIKSNHPESIIISSVINLPLGFRESLEEVCSSYMLNEISSLPISLGYEDPSELGKDRIASAVAVAMINPGKPALSIDLGSCITFDYVNASGIFEGGAISPGIGMRLKAMNQFTEKLPAITIEELKETPLVGKTTKDGMLSGVVNGVLREVDGIIDAYIKHENNLNVTIGGGDATFFEKNLRNLIFAEPNLVLKGLNQILQLNAR